MNNGTWTRCKLSDIGEIVGGATPSTSVEKYYGGEIPWLTPKDLSTFHDRYIERGVRNITEEGLNSCSARLLPAGSVLFSSRAPIGYVAIAKNPIATNQGFKSIIPKKDKIDDLFLYYLLTYNKGNIEAMGSGTTFKEVSGTTMKNIEVNIPSLTEQKRIAGILGAFDDKIELNRRINANLEEQAKALFKLWFVDNSNSNWQKFKLSDIATFTSGYSYKGDELIASSDIAMATIKNFDRNGGFKIEGFKSIKPSSKLKKEHYVELYDTLIAHTDLTQNAEVLGNAEIVLTLGEYNNVIFSMDLVKVIPKESFPYKYILAALLRNPIFKTHCMKYMNGTTVLHLSKKALPEFVVMLPNDKKLLAMNKLLKTYYHKMSETIRENRKLAAFRDTLLPKLMSGEISVEDVSLD